MFHLHLKRVRQFCCTFYLKRYNDWTKSLFHYVDTLNMFCGFIVQSGTFSNDIISSVLWLNLVDRIDVILIYTCVGFLVKRKERLEKWRSFGLVIRIFISHTMTKYSWLTSFTFQNKMCTIIHIMAKHFM